MQGLGRAGWSLAGSSPGPGPAQAGLGSPEGQEGGAEGRASHLPAQGCKALSLFCFRDRPHPSGSHSWVVSGLRSFLI